MLYGQGLGGAATELMKTITPAGIESWTHSVPIDWANESFAIAEQARTKAGVRLAHRLDAASGR